MSARLKVAVVGAGISNSPDGRERWAVRAHLPALKALPDLYETIAVCTTRMETAAAAARRFQVPHAFDNVERMLDELPEIDVVCVSVRPAVHHQVVMAALDARKHVYCEHPLGITTSQAQDMHDRAQRNGVRTIVGHEYHYEPAALQMAEQREGQRRLAAARGRRGEDEPAAQRYFLIVAAMASAVTSGPKWAR